MQRGKQKLYNTIVANSLPEPDSSHKRNTGIDGRRDAMAHRYYFHATINRFRYDDCLVFLHQEFFLQPNTIVSELEQRFEVISALVKNKVTPVELKKLYPWFNWTPRVL